MFIKNHISRNIYTSLSRILTLEPFVKIAIPQEYTSLGMKLEFSGIVWSQVRPAGAPKGAEKSIIRLCPKQAIKERVIINDFRRKSVNDKNISKKSFIPEFLWNRCMSKK